jgi:hypothetical protein
LLAAIAIWWASSLPVYMYFNPSWSHAHSAFVVALFFWYWLRTRESRTRAQWIVLALIAGLALNVYYPNVLVLAVLLPGGVSLIPVSAENRAPGDRLFAAVLVPSVVLCDYPALFAADLSHQVLHLREPARNRLHFRGALGLAFALVPGFAVFRKPRGVFLDTHLAACRCSACSCLRGSFPPSAFPFCARFWPSTISWPPIRTGQAFLPTATASLFP